MRPEPLHDWQIGRMHDRTPLSKLLKGHAEILKHAAICKIDFTSRRCRTHQRRNGVENQSQVLLSGPIGLARLMDIVNIAVGPAPLGDASRPITKRGSAEQAPPVLAIG